MSVLRRVNSPFMINTPLKEGQGKNTHTPPDGRGVGGEGGFKVTDPSVMRTLTSDVPYEVLL